MAKVEVNRGVLIALGGALAAAALAVAFLLGREAGHRAQGPAAPLPRVPAAIPPAAAPGMRVWTSGRGPETPAVVAPPSPVAASPAGDPARAAVAAYFDAVDHLGPGRFGGDPEAIAQNIVAGLAKGDSAGFDQLIAQSEASRQRFAALVPPPPCAGYHKACLADLDEGVGVARAMKKALDGQEGEGALSNLASRANALKARSEALQAEEQDLRRRYSLPR